MAENFHLIHELRKDIAVDPVRLAKCNKIPDSRKHDSLPIRRPAVACNSLPPKPLLHPQSPRLVEADPPALHDPVDLLLRTLIQPPSRVLRFDVLSQVEVAGVEACLRVFRERHGGWQARVAEAVDVPSRTIDQVVQRFWDRSWRCHVGDRRGVGSPFLARYVGDWRMLSVDACW